ncbi:MAG: hypothetical protein PUF14_03465 [Clostridiales bacterium]|nr:hypothetical protein [Clostridiales bacterium]
MKNPERTAKAKAFAVLFEYTQNYFTSNSAQGTVLIVEVLKNILSFQKARHYLMVDA